MIQPPPLSFNQSMSPATTSHSICGMIRHTKKAPRQNGELFDMLLKGKTLLVDFHQVLAHLFFFVLVFKGILIRLPS
jgi:hypothetical protein